MHESSFFSLVDRKRKTSGPGFPWSGVAACGEGNFAPHFFYAARDGD